ncbi:MAG: phosphopyruvate hydratase [Planctomycetota bacterium]|nr:phosphopyruvate hydratase [Planctomycetota bacterium]
MTMSQSSAIVDVAAYEILDSRGNPTLEVEVRLAGGATGTTRVPSGASTGAHEALELRDGGPRYLGRGVRRAVANASGPLAEAVRGLDATDPALVDEALRAADGTATFSALGANAVLGVSLAAARAGAAACNEPLWRFIMTRFGRTEPHMPVPMLNVLNGGAHADNGLDVQEIMLAPTGFERFGDALRAGVETYHALRALLTERGLSTAVGDEGGFAPRVASNEAAVELVARAIERAGYRPGEQIQLALDVAATEFCGPAGYTWEGTPVPGERLLHLYAAWTARYPIYSIEDGLDEDDWSGWKQMTEMLGDRTQLVGDDLFVTHPARVARGIAEGAGNAVLIKPNQVGTLSDTLRCVQTAYDGGFAAVMSHRSGETEDTTIADLAVALGTGQIKTGAPCRAERTAKYNRLLRIEAAIEAATGAPPAYGLPAGVRGVMRA